MIFSMSMGAIGPYILSMKDILAPSVKQYSPKRQKLKGWQKCQKKRK